MEVKVKFKNWFTKKTTTKTLLFDAEKDFKEWKDKNLVADVQSQANERIIGIGY